MADSSSATNRPNARLLDADLEHLNTPIPLRGYAAKPLVSLKEAVQGIQSFVDDVGSRVWTATNRSKNPADGLTPDESAAIVLYTIEWDPEHPSLYSILNQTLRREDRRSLIPWFSYLKLLLTALYKLPSIRCTIWRGVNGELRSSYKPGDDCTWWAFSSCTTSISVLTSDQYLGQSGSSTLFAIECLNGKEIKRHSYYKDEDEVLLLPCTHFKVIEHLSRRDGLSIIHLREVQPPYMLLEPPFPISTNPSSDQLDCEQHRAKIEELTTKVERVHRENQDLTQQNAQTSREIQQMNKANQSLKQKNEQLNEENQRLKAKSEQINQEYQSLAEKNAQITSKIDRISKDIERVNGENQCLKEEKQTLQKTFTQINVENQTLKEIMEQANNKIKRLEMLVVKGSMTDTPQTDAPAKVAPQRHLLSMPISSPNQNRNSFSVLPSPTPASSSSSTPSPSLRLAPTPSIMRGASVVGEQVSLGSTIRVTVVKMKAEAI